MADIHLIGSDGFIGRAVQRTSENHTLHCWSHDSFDPQYHFDLYDSSSWSNLLSHNPQTVIFLSWPGLPNYHDPFHITQNLPACISLFRALVGEGLRRLVVAGTCYEYGLHNGQLKENQLTNPSNYYAISKDTLRRSTANICESNSVSWCWLRIFYPYGEGQNQSSLLPSLYRAIRHNQSSFPMSSGKQIRDFIPVDEVARQLLTLASHPTAHGVFNGGSGKPQSLREFVENKVSELKSDISLDLGFYPDRDDEPLAFWADMNKFNTL